MALINGVGFLQTGENDGFNKGVQVKPYSSLVGGVDLTFKWLSFYFREFERETSGPYKKDLLIKTLKWLLLQVTVIILDKEKRFI